MSEIIKKLREARLEKESLREELKVGSRIVYGSDENYPPGYTDFPGDLGTIIQTRVSKVTGDTLYDVEWDISDEGNKFSYGLTVDDIRLARLSSRESADPLEVEEIDQDDKFNVEEEPIIFEVDDDGEEKPRDDLKESDSDYAYTSNEPAYRFKRGGEWRSKSSGPMRRLSFKIRIKDTSSEVIDHVESVRLNLDGTITVTQVGGEEIEIPELSSQGRIEIRYIGGIKPDPSDLEPSYMDENTGNNSPRKKKIRGTIMKPEPRDVSTADRPSIDEQDYSSDGEQSLEDTLSGRSWTNEDEMIDEIESLGYYITFLGGDYLVYRSNIEDLADTESKLYLDRSPDGIISTR